jgi:hypothetical protein
MMERSMLRELWIRQLTLDEACALGAALGKQAAANAHAARTTTCRHAGESDDLAGEIEDIIERATVRRGRPLPAEIVSGVKEAMLVRLWESLRFSIEGEIADMKLQVRAVPPHV